MKLTPFRAVLGLIIVLLLWQTWARDLIGSTILLAFLALTLTRWDTISKDVQAVFKPGGGI